MCQHLPSYEDPLQCCISDILIKASVGKMDPAMFLYDVPPSLMDTFCKIMDTGHDTLGWRSLASRILPSWLDVRCTERVAASGKSPTHEIMWTWAQQNKTVGDLIQVLEDMGHLRAIRLFKRQESVDTAQSPLQHSESYSEESSESHPGFHLDGLKEVKKTGVLITYSEIIEGTRNFHQDLKIGGSSFSDVYRGTKGNETFVVKVFKQVNKASWKVMWDKFKTEIEVLHLYQHPNILQLWGCFSEGNRFCLVYPYLRHGSLFHRLHDQDVERHLSRQERLDIIKGTAKAVHYLHTTQPCTVICGNITSSNILLDERLQPKLSDFGMAHLRPHSVNQSCTITMDTGSCGHLGYLPDEYIRHGKLSVKVDVYSFGMIVLETCTGQKVIQNSPKHTLLRDVLNKEVEDRGSVDACLHFLDPKAGPWPSAEALCLLRLGLECTAGKAKGRPDMKTVLQILSQLLPLPFPPDDQPHTLDDNVYHHFVCNGEQGPSMPTEDDEMYSSLEKPHPVRATVGAEGSPCECSQSEVTFLGIKEQRRQPSSQSPLDNFIENAVVQPSQPAFNQDVDLYGSWPVECSCAADGCDEGCEDCCANGFTQSPLFLSREDVGQSSQSVTENPAKERIRNKIQLYNRGLMNTEELLSISLE